MNKPKTKLKREKSTSTKGHYVTNSQLLPAVIEAKQLGYVTDKLISMIMKIAERYSHKHNFVGYSFREDMVCAAVMNLCNNALKFNPEKSSNPFSFYTTAIHNSFLQYMADEKKHRNIRDALLLDAGANPSFNFLEREKDESADEIKDSDDIDYDSPTSSSEDGDTPSDAVQQDLTRTRAHASLRAKSREPGPVVSYRPEDVVYDPLTGSITIKESAKPIVEDTETFRLRLTPDDEHITASLYSDVAAGDISVKEG